MKTSRSLLFIIALTTASLYQAAKGDDDLSNEPDSIISIDGFAMAPEYVDETIEDTLRSEAERQKDDKSRHPFDKACPSGYFVCDNGECIAPKWRCDGHNDCDDFSDEINCTSIDIPSSVSISSTLGNLTHLSTNTSINKLPVQVYGLDFNSSVEPMMIFSTGQSIRGLWMRSRLYFDIVSRQKTRDSQPSITEAFGLFFGMLGLDSGRGGSGGGGSGEFSKPDNTIVGLDMNPGNKEVFWVELGKDPAVYSAVIEDEQFETRHRRQFHGHKKIVEYGLVAPEDIAIDTVGRNIYITDAGLPAVVVCAYVHVHCRVMDLAKAHKPRAIIADSGSGWILYTDWGDQPGIYAISMDGQQKQTLIDDDIVWPNGLAQDYESDHLYWADARLNKIERFDLKSKERKIIVKETNTNPFSVSIFENRIYWSDWSGNDIKAADKNNGSNIKNVLHADDIYGIHIYHPDIQHWKSGEVNNPCWSRHCSHMCLLSPPKGSSYHSSASSSSLSSSSRREPISATCSCPDNMVLSVLDKSTCYEAHLQFLLINNNNYIAQIFPDRIGQRILEEIVYSKDHEIQDVAVDWSHYRLFFFDSTRRQIYIADFSHQKGATFKKLLQTPHSAQIRGMNYDYLADNLYWIDPDSGALSMLSVKSMGKFQRVIRTNLAQATSMVLDSKNRVLYVSLLGSRPKIVRIDLLSNNDVTLIDKALVVPVALHLDEAGQRLYWADAKMGTIESAELDIKSQSSGLKAGTRRTHKKNLGQVLALNVQQDYVMWITQDGNYLYRAKRDDRQAKPIPFKLPPNPSGLTSDHRKLLTVTPSAGLGGSMGPCLRRSCSHGCMVDRERQATCLCPDGYKLQVSNASNCIESSAQEPEGILTPPAGSGVHPFVLPHSATGATASSTASQLPPPFASSSSSSSATAAHIFSNPSSANGSGGGGGNTPAASLDALVASSASPSATSTTLKKASLLLQHSMNSQAGAVQTYQQHPAAALTSSSPTAAASNASSSGGHKVAWSVGIVFVLIVGVAVTLFVLKKHDRLPRGPITVGFTGGDKTLLLLDTDS